MILRSSIVSASWKSATAFPASHSPRRYLSTADAESINHFTRLASQWWDQKGEFALLHAMNPVRLQFMREVMRDVDEWEDTCRVIEARQKGQKEISLGNRWQATNSARWMKDLKVLDVGCGGGLLSESLCRLGGSVLGVDASTTNIEMAQIHAQQDLSGLERNGGSLQYRGIMTEDLLQEDQDENAEKFDVICAMEVIEHVKKPQLFLETLGKLLKPGGHLFMSTIARTNTSYFLTILMAEQLMRLVTPGTHKHDQYVNPQELIDHFEKREGWINRREEPDASSIFRRPIRLQYQIRGTLYLPIANQWTLVPQSTIVPTALTQLANYFFWIRKPIVE